MKYAVLLLIPTAWILQAQQPSSCKLPLKLVDVSHPKTIVGSGTPASCTEQALQAAIALGGIITFNCGSQAVTIPINSQEAFRNDMETVLDGGNKITIQGNGATRLFIAESGTAPWYGGTPPFYQSTHTSITFQNITLSNGRSSGTALPPLPPGAPPTCSQGTEIDGGGGVIYIRDMVLHVINSTFIDNHAAPLGPDVAGGGVYALGSVDVTLQGSLFKNNDGANGGAIGMLESNFKAVNCVFRANQALGHDGNHNIKSSGCPLHDNQYQVGDGGNAGAVYLDGQDTTGPHFCGNLFTKNQGGTNAQGGAIFGAGDPGIQNLTITQSEFDENSNNNGGAVYAYQNDLVITRSTFNNNTAAYGGAIQGDSIQLTALNNTFSGNSASVNIGALALFTSSGTLINNTFANNTAPHFPVLFPGSSNAPPPVLTITNNLFVSNSASVGHLACFTGFPGTGNFVWPPSSFTPAPEGACASDEVTANPLLGALAYNGGFTQTMPIPATSPAAQSGTTSCPALDQRGQARTTPCASGSYEPAP
jgi:predicted outer membrane repeat protein